MGEHGDDAGPADARRIVERRLRLAAGLERRDALLAERDHVLLGAELQAPGRARLHARRLDAHADAVDAQRALGHLAGLGAEPGHVERTPGRAQPAADARVRVDVDDAVLVLDDGARRRAGLQAPRIGAV